MQIATITTANTAPIVWTNKAGKQHTAHSATAQAFAPRAERITSAQAAELSKLANGQYRPFLQDVAATLTKADVKALTKFGFDLTPTNKAGMLRLLGAISGLWADAKGKRKALGEVAAQFIAAQAPELAEVSMPLPTIEGADTVDSTPMVESTPLPEIDAALL